jgi:exopolysaccharide biosynthesis operon protein EpsL
MSPRLRGLVLLLPTLLSPAAQAGQNDAFHPIVALSYSYEDNLLRVPEGQPAFDNTLADSSRSAIAGLVFDKEYGRQRLHAEGKLTKVAFSHFTQLDYDGKDVLARWNWQVGNDWSGIVSSTYNQVLAPYTDFQSSERNLRVQRNRLANAYWRIVPSWRVHAETSRTEFSYELLSQRYNDRTEDLGALGVDYLGANGSSFGIVAHKIKGKYPNKRLINTTIVDDGFEQDDVKANINWLVTGQTTVNFLGGRVKRTHASGSTNDSKGANGRLTVTQTASGHLQLNAAVWREFTALESSIVSYSLNDGVSAGAYWLLSEKTQLTANYSRETRNYIPSVPLPFAVDLSDRLATGSLSLNYTPLQVLQLSLSVYHQTRTGIAALGTGRYKANGLTLNATAQF